MTKPEYAGTDISDSVSILRDKKTKQATLEVNINGKWALYAGLQVDSIDFSKPILEGDSKGSFPLEINDSVRSYFQFIGPNSKMILSETHLPMDGGYNFRDLGGIKTTDGKFVKWGLIFRSDDLHNLTDGDLNYLASIPLISLVDFRSEEEINMAPDKVPSSLHADYPLSINPGNLIDAKNLKKYSFEQLDSLMQVMNTLLVTDSSVIKQYQEFFALIQNPEKTPLMFHCSAGKDRTGMGAALFLYALGVDDNSIYENYLASNYYLQDKYKRYMDEFPNLKPLFEVKKEFLQAGINQIIKDHGSVDNYLTKVLHVDIDKMRKLYLYN